MVSCVGGEGAKVVGRLSETVGSISETVGGVLIVVGEVLKTALETGVGVIGTISSTIRGGVSGTVDNISGSVDGVCETATEESEADPGVLVTVGKTIEMIGEGAVVGLVVVDEDNVIAAYSDLVVPDECTVEANIGPKITRQ